MGTFGLQAETNLLEYRKIRIREHRWPPARTRAGREREAATDVPRVGGSRQGTFHSRPVAPKDPIKVVDQVDRASITGITVLGHQSVNHGHEAGAQGGVEIAGRNGTGSEVGVLSEDLA